MFKRDTTVWGTLTFIFCPRVSLSAFLMNRTVAASVLRQGAHPASIGFSFFFDRYASSHCQGLKVYVRTSRTTFFIDEELKGFVSGRPRAGSCSEAAFISRKMALASSVYIGVSWSWTPQRGCRVVLLLPRIWESRFCRTCWPPGTFVCLSSSGAGLRR